MRSNSRLRPDNILQRSSGRSKVSGKGAGALGFSEYAFVELKEALPDTGWFTASG